MSRDRDVIRVIQCAVALLGLVLASLATPTLADPESGDVRFAVMGNRERDGTITGETVEVFVPWEGVNVSASTVRCLTGPFQLRSDGAEEHAQIGPDGAVQLRLRLGTDDDGTWEVFHTEGRCASLGGSGVFRRTLWADGAVSYRFIGEAGIQGSASAG